MTEAMERGLGQTVRKRKFVQKHNGYEIKPRASLYEADLRWTDLSESDLSRANLYRADLREASLNHASLCGADLREAKLVKTSLSGANLRGANLHQAALYGSNLSETDLRGARYSISSILMASWGHCPPDVTAQLQRLDAEALPHGYRLMDEWASGKGRCPLLRGGAYDRIALFKERRDCWPPKGLPWTMWQIWTRLAQSKNIKISMPWFS